MPHPSRFHQTAKKVLCTTALIVVAGMGLFYVNQRVNPFGISDHMDSYSQDLFNMVVGHLPSGTREALYPTTGQKEISVLLLKDKSIDKAFKGKWPITYSEHGEILLELLEHEPEAVVIHFFFRNMDKPGVSFLIWVLQEYKTKNIPVYLAFSSENKFFQDWPELEDLVIPAPMNIIRTPTDFVTRKYNVKQSDFPQIAVKVYRDIYKPHFTSSGNDSRMEMFWGAKANISFMSMLVNGPSLDCGATYTTTVSVDELLDIDGAGQEVKTRLKDKIVFYGGSIEGISGEIFTPTRQPLAGVYYHAMALDNLISLNGRYKTSELKETCSVSELAIAAVVMFVPALLYSFKVHRKKNKFTQNDAKTIMKIIYMFICDRVFILIWNVCCAIFFFLFLDMAASALVSYIAIQEIIFYINNSYVYVKLRQEKLQ